MSNFYRTLCIVIRIMRYSIQCCTNVKNTEGIRYSQRVHTQSICYSFIRETQGIWNFKNPEGNTAYTTVSSITPLILL